MTEEPDKFEADVSVFLTKRLTIAVLEEIAVVRPGDQARGREGVPMPRRPPPADLWTEPDDLWAEPDEPRPRKKKSPDSFHEYAGSPPTPTAPKSDSAPKHDTESSPMRWVDIVGHEMHLFICTKDRKYSQIRKQLIKETGHTQLVIVTTIAAAIGASIGAIAAAIVPVVALFLKTLLVLGKEAFCSRLSVRLQP